MIFKKRPSRLLSAMLMLIVCITSQAVLAQDPPLSQSQDAKVTNEQVSKHLKVMEALIAAKDEQIQLLNQQFEKQKSDSDLLSEKLQIAEDKAELYKAVFRAAAKEMDDYGKGNEVKSLETIWSGVMYAVQQRSRKPYSEVSLMEVHNEVARRLWRAEVYYYAEVLYRNVADSKSSGSLTAQAEASLIGILTNRGQWAEAVGRQKKIIRAMGNERRDVSHRGQAISSLLRIYILYENYDDALPWVKEHLDLQEKRTVSLSRSQSINYLIPVLRELKMYEEAESLARKTYKSLVKVQGEEGSLAFEAVVQLAWLLRLQFKDEEAEALDQHINGVSNFMNSLNTPFASGIFGAYLNYKGEYQRAETHLDLFLEVQNRSGSYGAGLNPLLREFVKLYKATGNAKKSAQAHAYIVGEEKVPLKDS